MTAAAALPTTAEETSCTYQYEASIDMAVSKDKAGLLALDAQEPEPNPECHIPIVKYFGWETPIIAEHIYNAQLGIVGDPKDATYGLVISPEPMLLAYNGRPKIVGDLTEDNRDASCTARRVAQIKQWYGPDYSCGEYPFASTIEGGAGASTRGAPNWEQDIQRDKMNRFYRQSGFLTAGGVGKLFAAVVVWP